jgi:hypothetical protein
MLGSLPYSKKNLGAPLQSRKAMLETLFRYRNMVRLSVGAILMVALVGCTGLIDSGKDGLTPQQRNARAKWQQEALPVLRASCITCHNGSRAGVGFLEGASDLDINAAVMKFDPAVVNLDAPGSSRIMTKGLHDGPALTAAETSSLLEWIQAEKDAQASDPTNPVQVLATPPFAIQVCTSGLPDNATGTCPTNHVALSTLGDAGALVPGAEISFTAQALSTGIYLSNLKLVAGTAGTYLEHPLFVSKPADKPPFPDQIDRFNAVKMNLMANTTDQISGGTAAFEGFLVTNMVEIHFKTVKAFDPGTGGPVMPSGCRVLASFKTNAGPQMQAACASCHAGTANPGAKSAMDITGAAAADDPTALLACNQVRTRINLTTTAQSGFYLAPDPASGTTHPFKFAAAAFTTFKNSVDIWVQAEKKAP